MPAGVCYDVRDAARVEAHVWHIDSEGYPVARIGAVKVRMHRFILCAKRGQQIDHKNRNKRDCRRTNLRWATKAQNGWNVGKRKHNTSGYKGVYFCKQTGRWRAEITAQRHCFKIGRYDTPQEAAHAYDAKARELHGAFAVTNF